MATCLRPSVAEMHAESKEMPFDSGFLQFLFLLIQEEVMKRRLFALLSGALLLSGCAALQPSTSVHTAATNQPASIDMDAPRRGVIVIPRPNGGYQFCAEPSPDVALETVTKLVCIAECLCDLFCPGDELVYGQHSALFDDIGKRHSLQILHDQKWLFVFRCIELKDSHDMRMIESAYRAPPALKTQSFFI